MFTFTSKATLLILSSFLATSSTTSAAPTNLEAREADAAVTVELCTAANFLGTCVTIPVVSDQCTSLTGGLTILNKEISSAVIPGGFICTFFEDFGCLSEGTSSTDEVALQGGSVANFQVVAGIFGAQSFNDLTSSFSCSVL